MTPLEKDIERALGRKIGKHGGLYLKWVCPGFAGVPDRICLLPGGRIVFIELKRPTGSVIAERQKWWAAKLKSMGFDALIIASHEEVNNFERIFLENDKRHHVPAGALNGGGKVGPAGRGGSRAVTGGAENAAAVLGAEPPTR